MRVGCRRRATKCRRGSAAAIGHVVTDPDVLSDVLSGRRTFADRYLNTRAAAPRLAGDAGVA
jgi:hypothetical protein